MTAVTHVEPETMSMLQEVMEDGFEPLIQSYISDSQHRIGELRVALTQQDSEMIRRLAHSLKGSSGNVGACHVAELCLQVEQQGREGTLDGLDQLLVQIEEELEEVFVIMQGYMH